MGAAICTLPVPPPPPALGATAGVPPWLAEGPPPLSRAALLSLLLLPGRLLLALSGLSAVTCKGDYVASRK